MEYLLRLTKLPTTDMLFNKWKGRHRDKNQQTSKVPERDGETSQLSSVHGVPAARPKLISPALLWSADSGEIREGGSGKVMEGW